ncbi:efflux RND transporter periplasmic adaptor subunit [Luteolibacter luteus]|uniref:HlyD family efflux transporter periplasmic adaptor subunit n=1 Tax=Luteolibacter luteus TaxID=2728835 RepID=A0A858RGT8_9BACT|nr:efflux RND transporter periplasmic adaptor subunit [Luteolibacter luteus]QJE95915.1 HlyD family efflux transporter periplasmic adaptor subunit [Luteolibacter luteus]
MTPSLDSLTRPESGGTPARRMPAWLIPSGIALGFAVLFLALFRDRLLPAPDVKTAVVLTTTGDAKNASASASPGNMLFQASGWIEADPLPVKATALIDGVVDKVMVLEGQLVKEGDPLATLIDADAKLALAAAERQHAAMVSECEAHQASIETLKKKLEGAATRITAARSSEDEAEDRYSRIKNLKSAISESDIVSARLRYERERSLHLAAQAEAAELEAEINRVNLETKAKGDGIDGAWVAVQKAKLTLERTKIPSPISGRVLRLNAAPGQKKMLQMDEAESSTIATLYDPAKLQVRVDVPLADAANLSVGQKAKIRCGLLPDKIFEGEVTRITGEADLQRNTLQAKVRILDPIDQLRPEMLCRVEFMGNASMLTQAGGALATWIPQEAVADGAAWVCDPESKRVSKRSIQASNETREGMVRISEGLKPGEHVVLSPQGLDEGQRVNPSLVTQ